MDQVSMQTVANLGGNMLWVMAWSTWHTYDLQPDQHNMYHMKLSKEEVLHEVVYCMYHVAHMCMHNTLVVALG